MKTHFQTWKTAIKRTSKRLLSATQRGGILPKEGPFKIHWACALRAQEAAGDAPITDASVSGISSADATECSTCGSTEDLEIVMPGVSN